MDLFLQDSGPSGAPLIKQTLSDQIYARLKDDIISHRIGFGDKLVNRELQKTFGVSSTPVRDAINHLHLDGLLEDITNVGARVVTFNLAFALEINDMVSVLAQGVIPLVAKQGQLAALADALEITVRRQGELRTVNEYILLDREFHEAFFLHCGNQHLVKVHNQYNVLMEMLVRLSTTELTQRATRMAQHIQILHDCRAGDVAALQRDMAFHYSEAAEWFTVNAALLGLLPTSQTP